MSTEELQRYVDTVAVLSQKGKRAIDSDYKLAKKEWKKRLDK